MSTTDPKIFTVMVWQVAEGKRRLRVHYVAGLNSRDAEARIKARNLTHLTGQCFITTDEHEAEYGDGCKLYTTEYTNEEHVSDDKFRAWVRCMTRPRWDDGDKSPPVYRRFHAEGVRKQVALELQRLAA